MIFELQVEVTLIRSYGGHFLKTKTCEPVLKCISHRGLHGWIELVRFRPRNFDLLLQHIVRLYIQLKTSKNHVLKNQYHKDSWRSSLKKARLFRRPQSQGRSLRIIDRGLTELPCRNRCDWPFCALAEGEQGNHSKQESAGCVYMCAGFWWSCMECLGGKEMHGQIFFRAWCRFFCQHGHAMLIYCYIQHRCNADGEAVYCPSELQGQLTVTSFLRTSLPRWTLLGGLVLTWSFQLYIKRL